jgi:hypothetical protein
MNPTLHAMGFCVFMFLVFLIVTDGYEDDKYSALGNILRVLRLIGRAIRWLSDHFSLGLAWLSACAAVWASFVTFLVGWYGSPVPPLDCWPVLALCLGAWGFERFYLYELKADVRSQAKQRGEL